MPVVAVITTLLMLILTLNPAYSTEKVDKKKPAKTCPEILVGSNESLEKMLKRAARDASAMDKIFGGEVYSIKLKNGVWGTHSMEEVFAVMDVKFSRYDFLGDINRVMDPILEGQAALSDSVFVSSMAIYEPSQRQTVGMPGRGMTSVEIGGRDYNYVDFIKKEIPADAKVLLVKTYKHWDLIIPYARIDANTLEALKAKADKENDYKLSFSSERKLIRVNSDHPRFRTFATQYAKDGSVDMASDFDRFFLIVVTPAGVATVMTAGLTQHRSVDSLPLATVLEMVSLRYQSQ